MNSAYSDESVENYKFTLSEKYSKIAEEELGENELRRKQCLQQFREWVDKNTNIEKCRKGV